jgi:hypothetical protein
MLTTGFSLYWVWKHAEVVKSGWRTELGFAVAFLYVYAWRYVFPDIDSGSERMTNLFFIDNYINGDRLPPLDRWFPPYTFNFYYAFQHYSTALLGRLLGLDAGNAYNLGFSLVVALAGLSTMAACWHFSGRNRWCTIIVAAVILGGTGASSFLYFMQKQDPLLPSSMRFVGDAAKLSNLERYEVTNFGRFIASLGARDKKGELEKDPVEISGELFGYLIQLGDFHAPLGGYLLLALMLHALAVQRFAGGGVVALGIAAATIPLTIICNPWNLPFQIFIVGGWFIYWVFADSKEYIPWKALVVGGGLTLMLCSPFLREFTVASQDFGKQAEPVTIKLVPFEAETPQGHVAGEHTPPLQWLIYFWPLLIVFLLGLLVAKPRQSSFFFVFILGFCWMLTELFYVDDVYSGKYNRFNTTLKLWPYIWMAILITIGSLNLRSPRKWIRWGTLGICLFTCHYAVWDYTRTFLGLTGISPNGLLHQIGLLQPAVGNRIGRLDGAFWLTEDWPQKIILQRLKAGESGVTLESMAEGGYTPGTAFSLFANKPLYLGWTAHEGLWRAYRPDINRKAEEIRSFYKGELLDAERWLNEGKVRYIVFLKGDNRRPASDWNKINDQIKNSYEWEDYYSAGDFHVGLWIRR